MAKSDTPVIIDGKVFRLSGFEEEAYLQQIASYLNHKIEEIKEETKGTHVKSDMRNLMVQINITDDLMKERALNEELENTLADCRKELALLRQEYAALQAKLEEKSQCQLPSYLHRQDLLKQQSL